MDMLKDSCKKSLVVFAIPIILSLLTQQFYNLCDTLIVGRMLGADMLSAVGNAGTIINITTIVCGGLELGGQMLFSDAMGRKTYGVIKKGVRQMLIFSAFTAVGISAGVIFSERKFLPLLGFQKNYIRQQSNILFFIWQGLCFCFFSLSAIPRFWLWGIQKVFWFFPQSAV